MNTTLRIAGLLPALHGPAPVGTHHAMRRPAGLMLGAGIAICLSIAGCGGHGAAAPAAQPASQPATQPSAAAASTPAPTLQGNAATNSACRLLSLEQVSSTAGLGVTGLLGLPPMVSPTKRSESCTWFLESKRVQSSLVVQYSLNATPPTEIRAYYAQVISQGYAKAVPQLGDISKITEHVIDTVYKRAEIHVTLLTDVVATPQDQAATVAFVRLVMAGIPQ